MTLHDNMSRGQRHHLDRILLGGIIQHNKKRNKYLTTQQRSRGIMCIFDQRACQGWTTPWAGLTCTYRANARWAAQAILSCLGQVPSRFGPVLTRNGSVLGRSELNGRACFISQSSQTGHMMLDANERGRGAFHLFISSLQHSLLYFINDISVNSNIHWQVPYFCIPKQSNIRDLFRHFNLISLAH